MPKNPFGQDDPLAGGGGGAWGAGAGQGAGGFGADAGGRGAAYTEEGEQYDVVDIAEPGAGVTAPAAGSAAPAKGGKTGNGLAASFGFGGKGGGAASGSTAPKDLAAREAALRKREEALARREASAARGDMRAAQQLNNWPPCYPLIHHDISGDVPEGKRGITRAGFFIFLWTIATLLYNLVAVVVTAIVADVSNIASSVIFACIYVLIGVPGAWLMWYKRLYRAMIFDGAASFATFFFSFLIHIAFAIYSAVAPAPGGSLPSSNAHAGLLAALDIIKGDGGGNKLGGILYFAGCGAWGFLAFISVLYLGRVYKFFRVSGAEDRARQQATTAATNAATGAATRRAVETF